MDEIRLPLHREVDSIRLHLEGDDALTIRRNEDIPIVGFTALDFKLPRLEARSLDKGIAEGVTASYALTIVCERINKLFSYF